MVSVSVGMSSASIVSGDVVSTVGVAVGEDVVLVSTAAA